MPNLTSREVHLKQRPSGVPTPEDFEFVSVAVADPGPGEVLVRNIYLSVDPYMRSRMRDARSYAAPFQLGKPMSGGCVGQVIESKHEAWSPGDFVLSNKGWREYHVSDGSELSAVDPSVAPIQAFLGVVGMPGQTAYFGLLDIGQPQPGETVFVSAAAGAVGSVVCQIAKLKGCRVVGSAGSQAKIDWLQDELGVDAAINYKEVYSLKQAVADECPDGVDIYYENVGGEHLEAAIASMNMHGRIPVCGMISQYNAAQPEPGPSNLALIIGRRIKLQGFIVGDYSERSAEFYADMRQWIADGKITWRETVFGGIERAPEAFLGLFQGDNIGKMLVKLADPDAV